ncbi:MAG TPA: sulfurtransferase [Mycobacteriales bacterium]|jgi:thiosulfate/3-mercaptopyruvate sulfurtransferase|nr:sulfurtransferase [Mycobacteriales bacterium]
MNDSGPLVGAADLAVELGLRPGGTAAVPVVLDVRWRLLGPPPAELYAAGHLPGAVAVDLDADLAAPPGAGGRHPLPDPADLQAALRRCGVRADSAVVAYDDGDGSSAARAWWLLRWAGHRDVRVLDGGFAAWTAAGLPTTTEVPAPAPGDIVVRPGGMPVLDAAGAAATAARGVLLDARAAERFRGEVEPVDPVAGHIPGARSAPLAGNVGPDGRFRPPAELRRRFAELGVTGDTPVGTYCGSGVTAAQQVLALELAGVPAALYAGSWSEWITDPARPVATGPEAG